MLVKKLVNQKLIVSAQVTECLSATPDKCNLALWLFTSIIHRSCSNN